MTRSITMRLAAGPFAHHDNCLLAAAAYFAQGRDLDGYDLSPRWEDNQRDIILLDIPACRYTVHPVEDQNCNSIDRTVVLDTADSPAKANGLAVQHGCEQPWGAAVLDTATGQVDFGFGFGEPVPAPGEFVLDFPEPTCNPTALAAVEAAEGVSHG